MYASASHKRPCAAGDNALRELPSPGKSGSVFWISHDDRFFLKARAQRLHHSWLAVTGLLIAQPHVSHPISQVLHFRQSHEGSISLPAPSSNFVCRNHLGLRRVKSTCPATVARAVPAAYLLYGYSSYYHADDEAKRSGAAVKAAAAILCTRGALSAHAAHQVLWLAPRQAGDGGQGPSTLAKPSDTCEMIGPINSSWSRTRIEQVS